MGFSNSGKNRRGKKNKMTGRDEDSYINAGYIPEDAREIVEELKQMFTLHSEQEIYATLLECKMDHGEAINRLLSQDSFQEVKSKRYKKKEAKEKKSIMGGRDEESSVNSDNIPADLRGVVQKLKEVVNCSEQETYKMLVKCNMNPDEAVNRLLSQDSFQQVENKRDEKKETMKTSDCQRIGSSNQNHEFTNGGDSYVGQCGGNKFNSDEMSNVQGIRNHVAGSSTTSGILGPPPLNSDLTKRVPISSSEVVPLLTVPSSQKKLADVVNHLDGSSTTFGILGLPPLNSDLTKRVPISSSEAVHSLSVPSSRLISASGCGTSGQKTMADVVKMSVNKAPFKDDCPLPEKREIPISFVESRPLNQSQEFARINQLRESASVHDYGGSRSNNKNDETYLVQKAKDPSVNLVECVALWVKDLQNSRFGTSGSGMNGSGQPRGLPSQCLNDDSEDISAFADDLSLSYLNIRDDECHEEEEQRLRRNVANEQMADQINSNATRNYHSSSNYGQTEPTQENQNKSSSATDFTFDNSQLFNPVMASSEPSLQRQNFNTFPNTMHQQAFTREPDPQYSVSPLRLSMPFISSLGRRLPCSITEALMASNSEPQMNGQAMTQQVYTREPDPQYLAPPFYQPMASINEPQMNGQAMNQQAYMRKMDPQYSAPPLHLTMDSINEPQMNGQAMNQQAYAREPDPQYSVPPHNQSMSTTSSLGRGLSASKTEAMIVASISQPQMNGQAMNHHYSQPKVPSGHYGTMMNYPYSQLTQNYTYNMSPSAIQQHGCNNNPYHLQPLAALLPQHINTDLSPSAVPFVTSAHSSTNGSTYNSANGFGMPSDSNAANSRFGSDNVFSSQLNNQLPSFQHLNGNSNVWAPQGSNYHRLFTGHQNQQSPSFRHSQQEQEQEQRYYQSLHQQSNRRDPSNQTQQQPRPSNNY